MASARCVIVASEWYETFGRTAAEALATGTPVLCSNLGALAEMVEHGRTGFHFPPGDAGSLSGLIDKICDQPGLVDSMRSAARRQYEISYTPDRNYEIMMRIYSNIVSRPGSERECSLSGG